MPAPPVPGAFSGGVVSDGNQMSVNITNVSPSDSRARAMLHESLRKSVGVAYLLLFFTSAFGGHRFYAGKTGSAITMLMLSAIGIPLCFIGIGFIMVGIVAVWSLLDLFLIPGMIREYNARVALL